MNDRKREREGDRKREREGEKQRETDKVKKNGSASEGEGKKE